MRQLVLLIFLIGVTTTAALCQKVTLEGYVFEELNRGYLNEVKVTVLEKSGIYVGETLSDVDGHFKFDVEVGKEYAIQYEKKIFQTVTDALSTVGKKADEKLFLKRQLERQPGYLLEVTLAEKSTETLAVDGINGSRVEIFNLTANREELVIDSAKSPVFSITLLQGYHYVIMIRKKGYFTRRMDAHVNIDGCYLCMEGFGTVTPGMVSNLTAARDNKIGTLIANVDLTRIDTTRNIVFQNIYYAYNSSELTDDATKELDKVTSLLQNNGALVVELGSHTDSRGSSESNLRLSQARAESAVNYILGGGTVDKTRLKAKGYGETRLANRCEDGIPCSETEHVRNRRTELKIIGFTLDPNEGRSLAEIVHAEEMVKFLKAGEAQKEYKATEATPPATPSVVGANNSVLPQQVQEVPKQIAVAKNPEIPSTMPQEPKAKVTVKMPEAAPHVPQGEPKTKVTPTTPSPSRPPALTIRQLETGEPPASYNTTATRQQSTPLADAPTMSEVGKGNAPTPKVNTSKPIVTAPTPKVNASQPVVATPQMPKVNTSPPVIVTPATPKVNTSQPVVVTPQPTAVATPQPKLENIKINLAPIPANFSGYKVELFTSELPLTVESDDLQYVGRSILSDIAVEKLKTGQHAYLVGTFLNWSETERFLAKVQGRYNKARIVEYFNGKRIG